MLGSAGKWWAPQASGLAVDFGLFHPCRGPQPQTRRKSLSRIRGLHSARDTRLPLEMLCQHLSACCRDRRGKALRSLDQQAHSLTRQVRKLRHRAGQAGPCVKSQSKLMAQAGFNTMSPSLGKWGHVLAGRLSCTASPKGTGLAVI